MAVKKTSKAETEHAVIDNTDDEISVKPKKEISYTDRVALTNTRS